MRNVESRGPSWFLANNPPQISFEQTGGCSIERDQLPCEWAPCKKQNNTAEVLDAHCAAPDAL